MRVVELHMDGGPIGSGHRIVVIEKTGHSWVHCIYPPTLRKLRLRTANFERAMVRDITSPRQITRSLNQLRRQLARRKRQGLRVPEVTVNGLLTNGGATP